MHGKRRGVGDKGWWVGQKASTPERSEDLSQLDNNQRNINHGSADSSSDPGVR